MNGTSARGSFRAHRFLVLFLMVGTVVPLTPEPASAFTTLPPITGLQVATVTSPNTSGNDACSAFNTPGSSWSPALDQNGSPADLNVGGWPTGKGGYVFPTNTEPDLYLCLANGTGPPIRKLYAVAGDDQTGRTSCFPGDIRLEAELNTHRDGQKEYLCYSHEGGRPLTDVRITTVAPPLGGLAEGDRLYTFQQVNLGEGSSRTLNAGGPLQYLFTRNDRQYPHVWGCGGEGEQACAQHTGFWDHWRGSGCDFGLRADSAGICRSHDRRTTLNQNGYRTGGDFNGSDAQWALQNQVTELALDEPINWATIVGTHNSYASWVDGEQTDPNQTLSITDQLRGGARFINLDLHFIFGDLRVCHNQLCLFVWQSRRYESVIKEISNWLDANPNEVIVITMEDTGAYPNESFGDAWVNDPIQLYLGNRVYKPGDCSGCVVDNIQRWPTRRELLLNRKQVVIFTQHGTSRGGEWMWPQAKYFYPGTSVASRIDYSLCKYYDTGIDEDLWDPVNGGITSDFRPAAQTWVVVSEDRTDLGSRHGKTGLIDDYRARRLAECNIGVIQLDMMHSAWWSDPRNDGPCDLGNKEGLDEPCPKPDLRVDRAVWSWASRPSDAQRYAKLDASRGRNGPRWVGVDDPTERHHFACSLPREGDPATWEDKRGEKWVVTKQIGAWHEGDEACRALKGQLEWPDGKGAFSVPRNGWMGEQLDTALRIASEDPAFDAASGDVWLNYHKDVRGFWRIVPKEYQEPSWYLELYNPDEPFRYDLRSPFNDGFVGREAGILWTVLGGLRPYSWQYKVTMTMPLGQVVVTSGSSETFCDNPVTAHCTGGRISDPINSPGHYLFEVVGSDKLQTFRKQVNFVIDHTPPTLELEGIPPRATPDPVTPRVRVGDETPVSQTWVLNGGVVAPGSTFTQEGRYHLVIRAVDAAGNENTVKADFIIDRTPPVASVKIPGLANAAGWYGETVPVLLDPRDDLSGISAVRWCLGATPPTEPCAEAGGPVDLRIEQQGTTYVLYEASNGAGLTDRRLFHVNVDTVAPVIQAVRTPPNEHGWNRSDVRVEFTCTDPTSGIDACSPPVEVTTEGVNQSVVGRAVDRAGNQAVLRVGGINIDRTPPTVSCRTAPEILWPANRTMRDVASDVGVQDALSGPAGFLLASVTSDQPDESSGPHVGDIHGFEVRAQDSTGQLRAERHAQLGDRTYEIRYRGLDRAGNAAACTARVVVPRAR